MKKGLLIHLLCLSAIAVTTGCKKAYEPAVITSPSNYLVVEGVLNAGTDSTKLRLTRTANLADTSLIKPENGATVYVLDDADIKHPLASLGNGFYAAPLGIQNAKQCKLHISVQGKEYESDMVTVDHTPAIDSLAYTVVGNGIRFAVFNHDLTNTVKYYRWDYDETYAYVALYFSYYKYENDKVSFRNLQTEDIYHCYNTLHSNQVIIASAAALSNSVINDQQITYVAATTGKIARGYSILLRQYALSKEAYEYWQKLKKNTEQLGSIFDAQPTALVGNLHCLSNDKEPVLGFVSASTVPSKRIFLDPHNLPTVSTDYFPPPPPGDCTKKGISLTPTNTFDLRLKAALYKGDSTLVEDIGFNGVLLGYAYAPIECADCRVKIKTGTNKKPPYWPANLQ